MLKDFKQFILRGNVVDLAVGIVVGAAFSSVVQALVKSFITPLVAAIYRQPDFSELYFTINNSKFRYGDFINALLSFLIIAAAIYFLVVRPINHLMTWSTRKKSTEDPSTKKCTYCLSVVPVKATRCPNCTSKLKA